MSSDIDSRPEHRIIPDSEGAGRFRGAPAATRSSVPSARRLEVMYASDANISPALGARGAGPGGLANQFKRERSGELTQLER